MRQSLERLPLDVSGVSIAFGGIKAATDVGFTAEPGRITSLIGPNGAGKTTVLNVIGGFYMPDKGSIRIGNRELAGLPAWKVARAGVARTYQTTKLFESMSVLDNVLVALRGGRLGGMLSGFATKEEHRAAEGLIAFVGYQGALATPAADLPHVDRRLVEIARALAMRPRVLLLDEPAAGLAATNDHDLLHTRFNLARHCPELCNQKEISRRRHGTSEVAAAATATLQDFRHMMEIHHNTREPLPTVDLAVSSPGRRRGNGRESRRSGDAFPGATNRSPKGAARRRRGAGRSRHCNRRPSAQ
jgi:ABC-type branched-subunit amino acid transport system ATPase component